MRPPHLTSAIDRLDKHIKNLQRFKGTLEALGPESAPVVRQHLYAMVKGWMQRLNMSSWWVAEALGGLLDDLSQDDSDATQEN